MLQADSVTSVRYVARSLIFSAVLYAGAGGEVLALLGLMFKSVAIPGVEWAVFACVSGLLAMVTGLAYRQYMGPPQNGSH